MSLSNSTLKLLNLKDENINFTEKVETSTILSIINQQFLCKEHSHTFIAHTNIVAPNSFIFNQVKLKVLETLSLKLVKIYFY